MCWDLNRQLLDHEASALIIKLTMQVRLKGVKVYMLNNACPIIFQVAICTRFRQFGKNSY